MKKIELYNSLQQISIRLVVLCKTLIAYFILTLSVHGSYAQGTSGYLISFPPSTTSIVCPVCPNNDCSGATTGITFGGYVRPDAFYQPPVISGVSELCAGNSTTLIANGGFLTYTWMDGANVIGSSQYLTVTPAQTTTYTLLVTNGSGCTASSSSSITVHENPSLTATANPPVTCSGSPTTLTAVSNTSFSGPQTLPSGYCSAAHSGSGPCITTVSLGSINNPSSSCMLPSYTLYAAGPGTTTTLVKESSYNLVISLSNPGFANAWIDWNRDGLYDPSNEFYNVINNATGASISITVPANAVLGLTSLRIRSQSSPSSNDACASYSSGETEDYPLNVTEIGQDPNVTYSWNPGALSGNSVTVTPPSSTVYIVTATDGSTGCSVSGSVNVNVINFSPNSMIFANPNPACINGTTALSVVNPLGGVNYFWEFSPNGSPTSWMPIGTGPAIQSNVLNFPNNFFRVTSSCGMAPPVTSNPIIVNAEPCLGQSLYVKLFLEGYYSGGGIMNNVASPPIGGLLYHVGMSSDPMDVDYVTLSAMEANPPHNVVESQTGILKRDGNINVNFTNAIQPNTGYFIKVSHRNSIETWSGNPIIISQTSPSNPYNFTNSANKAFGNNQTFLGDGNFAIYSGDISSASTAVVGEQDGLIESQDYGDMENAVYVTLIGYVTEDITGDGIVESSDYGLIETNTYFARVMIRP